MKRIAIPMLAAMLLLAADRSGVRPRRAPKDYPAYGSAGGITIAAAVVPASKVQHQLSPDMVKAGYTVLEIAVYPDPGKDAVVSSDDFSMTNGSNPDTARADTPAAVAGSIEADNSTNPPQIPGRVQVHGEETIGVSTGGYDPITGRRYPGGVYTATGVGVGAGDPRVGDPAPADPSPTDPRYPAGDPRYPDPRAGAGAPPATQATPRTVRDKLEEKALPEGRTLKAVAGYVYFPKVSPRLVNSSEPYRLNYSGPTGQIHLTVPAK
jgi:hypothetical protein